MAESNGKGPRIQLIKPGSGPIADGAISSPLSREEFLEAEVGLLQAQVRQLQSAFEAQRQAVNIHHLALVGLEARTLAARWRRLTAWLSAAWQAVLDHIDPTPEQQARRRAVRYQGRDLTEAERAHAIAQGWLAPDPADGIAVHDAAAARVDTAITGLETAVRPAQTPPAP